jgi:hypothetical protein
VGNGVSAGDPLPDPYPIFANRRAVFRRGAMQLIAGPPGSMKTVLTLNIVRNMKVPTLYFSSDSDDFTIASRLLARETGETTDMAEVWLRENQDAASRALRVYDHINFCFDPAPTLDKMWMEAEAFREIHGDYPEHTVIDILMDVDTGGEGGVDMNFWTLMADLKVYAREQQTSLTLVHHTSEAVKGEPCPPRSAIMGKANQLPTLILTLNGNSIENYIDVAVVKNRFGPQDPSGRTFFRMDAKPSICTVSEKEDELLPFFRDGIGVPESEKMNPQSGA